MLLLIYQYIKFLLKSKNQHGVHSPFVYTFVTKCLYQKVDKTALILHKSIRQQLLNNSGKIKVLDFGSGSKVFKNNDRKIADIAKIAGISSKKTKILIKVIQYFKPKQVLEIGTSLGLGTSAIKIGNNNSKITTLEGCPETGNIAQDLFNKNQFKNIESIIGNFSKTIPEVLENNQFDLIYFDGNHTKKGTLEYFKNCLSKAHNNTIFIFDDIYWSKEMIEAWQEIKKHEKVSVTVDVFHFGIVFFRKEQEKEHFKIRA